MVGRLKRRRSTRKQSSGASFFILVAVIIVCMFTVHRASELNSKSRQLGDAEKALEKEIELAQIERENLEAQQQYMQTKKYIEDVAKDKLGLVYPDEIVIKPSE